MGYETLTQLEEVIRIHGHVVEPAVLHCVGGDCRPHLRAPHDGDSCHTTGCTGWDTRHQGVRRRHGVVPIGDVLQHANGAAIEKQPKLEPSRAIKRLFDMPPHTADRALSALCCAHGVFHSRSLSARPVNKK